MDTQQLVDGATGALREAFNMGWEVFWPLILGFALSGAVQAVVSRKSTARLLGGESPTSLTFATLFGVASSSCSYAAVALARSLFLKGASFTSAMAFELASTNLVIELGVILIVLMGWGPQMLRMMTAADVTAEHHHAIDPRVETQHFSR